MTTTITVQSHNYPARVLVLSLADAPGRPDRTVSEHILIPEDGVQTFHCTTSQEIRVVDLEYDHPSAQARMSNAKSGD